MNWTCTTCSVEKLPSEYWKQKNKRGHMAECKGCSSERTKAWVHGNRDQYRLLNLAATHKYRTDYRSRLVDYARRRAAKSGLEFDLAVGDLEWPEVCPVLGIPLFSRFGSGGRPGAHDDAPSLDRIDNTKGYIRGNVVVVSYRANRIKSDATAQELETVARFYARLDANTGGQADLSAMQPPEEEQARQVPLGVVGGQRLAVVLPQPRLRFQGSK